MDHQGRRLREPFWLPSCMGGAIGGQAERHLCTCRTATPRQLELEAERRRLELVRDVRANLKRWRDCVNHRAALARGEPDAVRRHLAGQLEEHPAPFHVLPRSTT